MPLLEDLRAAGCEIRGDRAVVELFADAKPATDEDWSTEYLDAIISVKLVDGIGGAIQHINHFSSHHTEAVIAEDAHVVERFFNEIDSAILLHNASTQFADGGEFGMGAEIGIATGKMHARGPSWRRAIDLVQVPRARQWPDSPVTSKPGVRESFPGVSEAHLRMPFVEKGMTVGLFGGSFNPPHAGHALVAEIALRRLKLDQLWWIVTPGQSTEGYAPSGAPGGTAGTLRKPSSMIRGSRLQHSRQPIIFATLRIRWR